MKNLETRQNFGYNGLRSCLSRRVTQKRKKGFLTSSSARHRHEPEERRKLRGQVDLVGLP